MHQEQINKERKNTITYKTFLFMFISQIRIKNKIKYKYK